MARVLVIEVQIPHNVVKNLIIIFKIFHTCKCCMLPNCITNFACWKPEQMYNPGTYFHPLECVCKSCKLPLSIQISLPNFLFFLLQHSHIHHIVFSAINHVCFRPHLPLPLVLQFKNIKRNHANHK